jgi:hypothetical protein
MTYAKVLGNTAENATGVGNTCTAGSGGNTGGTAGDYADIVQIGAGAYVTHTDEYGFGGSRTYKVTVASATAYLAWNTRFAGAPWAHASGAIRFRFGGLPVGGTVVFLKAYSDAAGTSASFAIGVNATGSLVVTTPTGGTGTFTTTAGWVAAATDYRLEWELDQGTSMTLKLYTSAGTTVLQQQASNATQWSAAVSYYRAGVVSNPTYMSSSPLYFELEFGTGLGMPTVASNVAPVVSAGANQSVAINTTVTLAGTAADTDGTVASTSWTQLTGPTVILAGTGVSRTFTPTVGNVYTFEFSATDDAGLTATAITTVRVRSSAATIYEITTNTGGFTNEGGAPSMIDALGDAYDATLIQSPAAPAGATITAALTPLRAGVVTLVLRHIASSVSPAVSRLVELLNGATVLVSETVNPVPATETDRSISSPASVAADAALYVRITDTQV